MKGCLWSLPLSPSPIIPEFHAPVPHSLGESHVSSVKQELLPPVGAHQGHCLLIQPNLCHTAMLREARQGMRGNRAGLTRLLAPGRGSVVTPLPMQRREQERHPQRWHWKGHHCQLSQFQRLNAQNTPQGLKHTPL